MRQELYKIIAVTIFLFVLFLFSGGIYEYSEKYKYKLRVNKVTGTVEKNSKNGWVDVTK